MQAAPLPASPPNPVSLTSRTRDDHITAHHTSIGHQYRLDFAVPTGLRRIIVHHKANARTQSCPETQLTVPVSVWSVFVDISSTSPANPETRAAQSQPSNSSSSQKTRNQGGSEVSNMRGPLEYPASIPLPLSNCHSSWNDGTNSTHKMTNKDGSDVLDVRGPLEYPALMPLPLSNDHTSWDAGTIVSSDGNMQHCGTPAWDLYDKLEEHMEFLRLAYDYKESFGKIGELREMLRDVRRERELDHGNLVSFVPVMEWMEKELKLRMVRSHEILEQLKEPAEGIGKAHPAVRSYVLAHLMAVGLGSGRVATLLERA